MFIITVAMALPLMAPSTRAHDATLLAVDQDPSVDAFLTGAEGNTLYHFTPDTVPGESTCYDECPRPGHL